MLIKIRKLIRFMFPLPTNSWEKTRINRTDRTCNGCLKQDNAAHLECPIKLWTQQVVVPIDALVQEGPEAFVFKKFDHTHETEDGDVILEFEKIPVKVLHADRQHAVLEKQVTLDTYEQYALNHAFQLNLALKQAAAWWRRAFPCRPQPLVDVPFSK